MSRWHYIPRPPILWAAPALRFRFVRPSVCACKQRLLRPVGGRLLVLEQVSREGWANVL